MKATILIEQKFSNNEILKNQKIQIFENEEMAKKELKRIKEMLKNTPTFKITIDGELMLSFQNLTAKYNFIITKL